MKRICELRVASCELRDSPRRVVVELKGLEVILREAEGPGYRGTWCARQGAEQGARGTGHGTRDTGHGARGTGHGARKYRAARGTSRETGKCKHMVKKEEKHVERRKEKITTQRDKPEAIISCANVRSKEFVKSTFVQDVEEHV